MLQLYNKEIYLIAGDQHVRIMRCCNIVRDDNLSVEDIILRDATWEETRQAIESGRLDHLMYVGQTFWKKRPYISTVGYNFDNPSKKFFQDDSIRFTVGGIYLQNERCTMHDIIKYARADQAVQWFKERGLTICPLK